MVVLWCGRNKHVVVVTDKRIGGSAASSGLFRGANTSSEKSRPSLCGTNAVIQQLYSTMYFWMIDIRVLFRHNTVYTILER